MHSASSTIQLFAESVQNPNMHYEKVYCKRLNRLLPSEDYPMTPLV